MKGLGAFYIGGAVGGVNSLTELHSVGLVTGGDDSPLQLRLAAQLPSFEDSSVELLADGRMQTTWRLRPDALWHDGHPFTADDVVFGSQVFLDPAMGMRTPNLAQIERVDALDPHTIRVFWKSTYFKALNLGVKELGPLPAHLLKETYLADRERFQNLPYWTSEYVQLGPFRLIEFGLGESLTFERFDAYFLGRPQLDRVRVHVIGDPNVLYSHLLAGAVDVAAESTLSEELSFKLRDDWRASGGGRVLYVQGLMDLLLIQFHPDRVSPPELGRDPRVRRGLFQGLDREAIQEYIYPGFGDLVANTFLVPGDPRIEVAGRPYARYRFDAAAAGRTFEEAGWRHDANGRLVRQNGEVAELTIRGDVARKNKVAVLADQWRRLGFAIDEEFVPPALVLDREYRASITGVEWSMRGGDLLPQIFLSSQFPTLENRFGGANRGSYSNAAFDRLTEQLYVTVDEREQGRLLRDIGEIWANDFPFLPLHYNLKIVSARQGVRTLGDGNDNFWMDRNAHLWSRE